MAMLRVRARSSRVVLPLVRARHSHLGPAGPQVFAAARRDPWTTYLSPSPTSTSSGSRPPGAAYWARPMHTRMFACPQTHATPHSTGCSSQRPNPRPAPAPRVSCASWASSALASRWAPPSAGSPSHSHWPCTCHVSLTHPTPVGPEYYIRPPRSKPALARAPACLAAARVAPAALRASLLTKRVRPL